MSVLSQPLVPVPAKEQIIPMTEKVIRDRRSIMDNIVATVTAELACFDNVLSPMAEYDNQVSGTLSIIQTLKYASPDQETQSFVEQADKIWGEYYNEVQKRMEYVRLVQAVGERKESLHPEAARMLEKLLAWYKKLGYGNVDDETRQQFMKAKDELMELCAQFNRNIRLYDGGDLLFTDDQLAGLSETELGRFEKDTDAKRRVPMKRDNYALILRKAKIADTRKLFATAWSKRLSENVPIFRKAILLRDENARRMGYKSYAEFCLPGKMVKSTEWIEQLHEDLAQNMLPQGKKYFEKVKEKKRFLVETEGASAGDGTDVFSWDVAYINRLLEEEENVDFEAISEYLPFKETISAILEMLAGCLQVRLEPLAKDELVGNIWSDDVTVWAVRDVSSGEDDALVGYLYGDFEDRKNKYKHNQTVTVQESYIRPDGTRVLPSTILMCSFSPETVDGCKLLRHQNVKTLVHEFGHAMQELFSRTKYERFHGYRVAAEFGEAIGTMMENYAYLKAELREVSCHYTYLNDDYKEAWLKRNPGCQQPPRELPDSMLDSLISSRPKRKLVTHLDQLGDSIFDLSVHNPATHEDLEKLDETKFYVELEEKFSFVRSPEIHYPQAAFSHLMSGYQAGYYAYICSNVFGEELFDHLFAADPRDKKAWAKLRRELLQYGGSRDETELLEEFLGRKPTPDAFLRRIGIKK